MRLPAESSLSVIGEVLVERQRRATAIVAESRLCGRESHLLNCRSGEVLGMQWRGASEGRHACDNISSSLHPLNTAPIAEQVANLSLPGSNPLGE